MADAAEIARRLAQSAEAVCRAYLSNGRREGRYWIVGDVANTPGRSLFVRLRGPVDGPGRAGRWRDAATGEQGDLIDLITIARGLGGLGPALEEARAFLREPSPPVTAISPPALAGSPEAARRLFAMSRPVRGTAAESYLRSRGITCPLPSRTLRFHPACWYRPLQDEMAQRSAWPALITAVTDLDGEITGVQRTWLNASAAKADVATPRRALGQLHRHAARIGAGPVLAAGEGLETLLSLRSAFPKLPVAAALSAAHLAALSLPWSLRRLYVAQDADAAGARAAVALAERARHQGVEAIVLEPAHEDFNADLMTLGLDAFRLRLQRQLAAEDAVRLAG